LDLGADKVLFLVEPSHLEHVLVASDALQAVGKDDGGELENGVLLTKREGKREEKRTRQGGM